MCIRCDDSSYPQAVGQRKVGDAGLKGPQHVLAAAREGLGQVFGCQGASSPAVYATCTVGAGRAFGR